MSVAPVALVGDLTPQWLTAALGAPVTEVSAAPVGTGQMGECYRLDLHGAPGLPATVIAKLPTSDRAGREMLHGSYATEVAFYRDLLPGLAVRAPRGWYADISDDPDLRGTFTLLLEDLAEASQGDQVAGCTVAEAEAAVVNLAGLHAPRWCDEALLTTPGVGNPTQADADLLDAMFPDAVETTLAQVGALVGDDDAALLRSLTTYAGRWSLRDPGCFALLHGDYRLDNLMFHPDGRVWAVDWQTLSVGHPLRDVAFLLGTGLPPAERRATERELVAAYHRRLSALGVTAYALETCWDDYRRGMLQGPLIAVFGCAFSSSRTERGDRMFAAMLGRSLEAIRELDTVALLTRRGDAG